MRRITRRQMWRRRASRSRLNSSLNRATAATMATRCRRGIGVTLTGYSALQSRSRARSESSTNTVSTVRSTSSMVRAEFSPVLRVMSWLPPVMYHTSQSAVAKFSPLRKAAVRNSAAVSVSRYSARSCTKSRSASEKATAFSHSVTSMSASGVTGVRTRGEAVHSPKANGVRFSSEYCSGRH